MVRDIQIGFRLRVPLQTPLYLTFISSLWMVSFANDIVIFHLWSLYWTILLIKRQLRLKGEWLDNLKLRTSDNKFEVISSENVHHQRQDIKIMWHCGAFEVRELQQLSYGIRGFLMIHGFNISLKPRIGHKWSLIQSKNTVNKYL